MINENEGKIIFNTPQNFNVFEIFSELSLRDIPKVEYLLNQINYFDSPRGYQVHISNHAWSLCMNNGEIISILNKLVDLNIIYKVKESNPGINSNAYRMVKPYTNDTSKKTWYKVEDYLFLQKLKTDFWIAKGSKHSNYIKPAPEKPESDLIASLQARIKELEAEVTRLSTPVQIMPKNGHIAEIVPVDDGYIDMGDIAHDKMALKELDGFLLIKINDIAACIENYDEMQPWVDNIEDSKKEDMINTIINSPVHLINYPINKVTKVRLSKVVEAEDKIIITFRGLFSN